MAVRMIRTKIEEPTVAVDAMKTVQVSIDCDMASFETACARLSAAFRVMGTSVAAAAPAMQVFLQVMQRRLAEAMAQKVDDELTDPLVELGNRTGKTELTVLTLDSVGEIGEGGFEAGALTRDALNELAASGLKTRSIQLHDEVILEVGPATVDEVKALQNEFRCREMPKWGRKSVLVSAPERRA